MANDTPLSLAPSIDPDLVGAVKSFEGFAPKAQWDVRQWSSGYGTRGKPGEVIDEDTAHQRLMTELGNAQGQVDALGVPLTQGQRNALTSLTFNAGPSWMKSGLGDAVRAGDWDKARSAFLQYNTAAGKPLPGLTARRQAEASWMGGGMPNYASLPTAASAAADQPSGSAQGAGAPPASAPSTPSGLLGALGMLGSSSLANQFGPGLGMLNAGQQAPQPQPMFPMPPMPTANGTPAAQMLKAQILARAINPQQG